jgi:hypothetical protein
VLLGGAGTWLGCYGFGKADWDFPAGGELCDSAGKAGCPREKIAIGTEMGTYEFMNVPQIPSLELLTVDCGSLRAVLPNC